MRVEIGSAYLWLLIGTAVLPTTAHAQIDPALVKTAERLHEQAMSSPTAFAIVESLTMEVGPRLAGTPGDAKAVDWAVRMLKAQGFANVRLDSLQVPQWRRGELTVQLTLPASQPLVAASLGGSVGTGEEGIEAEVVRVTSLDDLATRDPQTLAGKIVFIDKHTERTKTGNGYSETVPIRTKGASAAAGKDAIAVVIRSVGTDSNRVAHTGSVTYEATMPKIPAVALANPDADILAWHLQGNKSASLRIFSTARQLDPAWSANVIGEIPGTDRADEIVLLGAHLDSWDLGTGAIDDGAGVAIVTAAAKLIGELPRRPVRTIRVVLFANEEFGLSGGRNYGHVHRDEVGKHIVGMESDFGASRVWRLSSQVSKDRLPLVAMIANLLKPLGIEPGGNEATGGADLKFMREAGMPVFTLDQDGTDYFDYHHTINDTLDKIEKAALDQNVAAMAITAYAAASIDGDFGRLPPPEKK